MCVGDQSRDFNWLPLELCVDYKVLIYSYKAVHNMCHPISVDYVAIFKGKLKIQHLCFAIDA